MYRTNYNWILIWQKCMNVFWNSSPFSLPRTFQQFFPYLFLSLFVAVLTEAPQPEKTVWPGGFVLRYLAYRSRQVGWSYWIKYTSRYLMRQSRRIFCNSISPNARNKTRLVHLKMSQLWLRISYWIIIGDYKMYKRYTLYYIL